MTTSKTAAGNIKDKPRILLCLKAWTTQKNRDQDFVGPEFYNKWAPCP